MPAGTKVIQGKTVITGTVGQNPNGEHVLLGLEYLTSQDNITAHPGGGQANATAVTAQMARVTAVATAGDSVLLPLSGAGLAVAITNAGANSMNVFPQTGEIINALGANAAFAIAAGKTCEFDCFTQGQWHTLLSA